MEFSSIIDIFFKISAIIVSIIFLIFSIVVSKQVNIMTKTLEDKFNWFIILISSLQVTVALILIIFAIFLS